MGPLKYSKKYRVWYYNSDPFSHYEWYKRHGWTHAPFAGEIDSPSWMEGMPQSFRLNVMTNDPAVAAGTSKWMTEAAREAIELYMEDSSRGKVPAGVGWEPSFPDGLSPYDFQAWGIYSALERLKNNKSVLIADMMGLGKTIQAIGILNELQPRSVLIVCPASLQYNWAREVRKWGIGHVVDEEFDVQVGTSDRLCTVRVISYAAARRLGVAKYEVVVFDEAHALKNPSSKQSEACLFGEKSLFNMSDKSIFLTGTPAPTRATDIWWALYALGIDAWPDKASLVNCFKGVSTKGGLMPVGIDAHERGDLLRLNRSLRLGGMIRRDKARVLPQLPGKVRRVISMEQKSADRAAARAMEAPFVDLIKSPEFGDAAWWGKMAARLSGSAMRARREVSLRKVAPLVRYIKETSTPDDSLVIYTVFRDTIDALVHALGGRSKVALVHGGIPKEHRQGEVDSFQSGEKKFFVGQITAAGTGHTLTRSSRLIMLDISWTPGEVEQVEDRIHRIGQENSCLIEYVAFEGSLDQRMMIDLVSKTERRRVALDGGGAL